MKKKKPTPAQEADLFILKRKRKVLLDNKENLEALLRPVLDDLEEIRLKIDEIELE